MSVILIICVAFIAVIFFVIKLYNKLVLLKNRSEEAWSDIDVQLKQRYDLIPNIVETVKGYAGHEKETLENVVRARNQAISTNTLDDGGKSENVLTSALQKLFALAESYPDLKANQNFMQLQGTLEKIEEKIQLSRRYYNAIVRDLNTSTEVFPSNVIANMFNFKKRNYIEIDETERQNVKVKF
mgnify:CR=1 FL=1